MRDLIFDVSPSRAHKASVLYFKSNK